MALINFSDADSQGRTPVSRGRKLALILGALMLVWIVYKQNSRSEDDHRSSGQAMALVSRAMPEIKPPAEKEPQPMPVPRPQAQAPRPQPKPQAVKQPKPNPFVEMQKKKRLEAIWAPLTGGKQSQERAAQEAPQTLEIPSANGSGGRSIAAQGVSGSSGSSVWNSRFDQRGTGQPGVLQRARSPYVIRQGWKIPVRLIDPINTDTEGQITAVVIEDVYDSATGRHLLIPAGATIIGSYDTRVGYSQERLPSAWHVLNFPNGDYMSLAAMPGANREGYAGLDIKTNNHLLGTASRALLMTITGAAGQMATQNRYNGSDIDPGDALAMEAGRELRSTGRNALRRGLHRQPTGTAESGQVFFVQVTAPLVFPAPYDEGTDFAAIE